jgi:putative Mn2+ efflux pump MntP
MEDRSEEIKNIKINHVLGLFILFFGLVVWIAILFTETSIGQITNFVAGFILVMIGGGMLLQAKRKLKKYSE